MDIITIIVLTGITNLTFALYSWQQVRNPESHSACKFWAQAHFIKAISFVIYAVALSSGSNDLRLLANILILLGCWAEVRAYIKLSAGSIKTSYLFIAFVVSSAVFTFMHVNSSPGPNNTMIITASFLLVVPLFMNVVALYSLSKQLFMFTTFISGLGNGIGFIGFLKERSDAKLQQRANFDYLTGVHNRQHFESLAEQAHLIMGEPLTFSCGVCATQKGTTIQNLMREADTLLYQAKRNLQTAQS